MIPFQDIIDQLPNWVFLVVGFLCGGAVGITIGFIIAQFEFDRHRGARAKSREYAQDTLGNPNPRGSGDERIPVTRWLLAEKW